MAACNTIPDASENRSLQGWLITALGLVCRPSVLSAGCRAHRCQVACPSSHSGSVADCSATEVVYIHRPLGCCFQSCGGATVGACAEPVVYVRRHDDGSGEAPHPCSSPRFQESLKCALLHEHRQDFCYERDRSERSLEWDLPPLLSGGMTTAGLLQLSTLPDHGVSTRQLGEPVMPCTGIGLCDRAQSQRGVMHGKGFVGEILMLQWEMACGEHWGVNRIWLMDRQGIHGQSGCHGDALTQMFRKTGKPCLFCLD